MNDSFSLRSRSFVLVCISSFLYFGSFYLLLPTLPQYVAVLGGTTAQIGLVMAVFTLTSVIVRPYFGRAVDRHGRKGFMLFGAALFATSFAAYSQIHAIFPLYAARAVHGIAHGSYLAAAYAYVADLAPAERRGEVMGVYGIANVISMALFPALGEAIIGRGLGFSTLFLISTVVSAGAFVVLFFVDEIKAKADQHAVRTRLITVVAQRAVLVASLALFSAATIYGAIMTFLPVYAPTKGLNGVAVPFFSTYAVFTLVSRLIAGKLSDRFGRRKVAIPFLGIVALAALMLPLLRDIYLLMFIGACFGLGFGAFMPALNAYVVDETRPQERAAALSFFTAFMDVGITTGAFVLGIVGQYVGYGPMFFVGGLIVVAGTILFAAAGKTKGNQSA
jgi:MFS family permease